MIEPVIGVVAIALGLLVALWSIRFFQRGRRHATNTLWFLGRWGPPQNDPRPAGNREERRSR